VGGGRDRGTEGGKGGEWRRTVLGRKVEECGGGSHGAALWVGGTKRMREVVLMPTDV
jgi:hypothetical protein